MRGSSAGGELLNDDLEPGRNRHTDDRPDQPEERPEREDACEHGEPGDLGCPATRRRTAACSTRRSRSFEHEGSRRPPSAPATAGSSGGCCSPRQRPRSSPRRPATCSSSADRGWPTAHRPAPRAAQCAMFVRLLGRRSGRGTGLASIEEPLPELQQQRVGRRCARGRAGRCRARHASLGAWSLASPGGDAGVPTSPTPVSKACAGALSRLERARTGSVAGAPLDAWRGCRRGASPPTGRRWRRGLSG
jgi:hypothetical protein